METPKTVYVIPVEEWQMQSAQNCPTPQDDHHPSFQKNIATRQANRRNRNICIAVYVFIKIVCLVAYLIYLLYKEALPYVLDKLRF